MRFFIYQLKHVTCIQNRQLLHFIKEAKQHHVKHPCLQDFFQYVPISNNQKEKILWQYQQLDFEQLQAQYQQDTFLLITDTKYPYWLYHIYDPPAVLFYRGHLSWLQGVLLAMIGSRQPDSYAMKMMDKVMPDLLAQSVTTVSGLARGLDTYAHRSTIKSGGKTIGVIGNGLEYCYPKENQELQHYMANNHLVLSEHPWTTSPKPYYFPLRNRIIAGISQGTCVFKAGRKSGTEITAMIALEEGRHVFAVPGEALDEAYEGCHHLIKDGAKIVTCGQDILEELL